MRLDLSPQLRLELRLKLAPQMIQSMEILQLPLLALQERIEQELVENPVLEAEPRREEAAETSEAPPAAHIEADVPARATEDFRNVDRLPGEWERYIDDPLPTGRRVRRPSQERDPKLDAMANTAAPGVSLQEVLEQQIGLLDLEPEMRETAHALIWNIDDNGYLRFPLAEIVASMDGRGNLEVAERALVLIQALDPPGVGARDLRECLLLQLDRLAAGDDHLLRTLIEHHLGDIEQNRLPHIAKATGADLEAVKAAIAALARLSPRPGSRYVTETVPYVIPDVIVEATDRGYEVHLEDSWTPHLYISREYRDLARQQRVDAETREFVTAKIRSAKWLIDSIEQRRTTLLAVARSIVTFQEAFLDRGLTHIRPLKMQTVADDVSVHVSTVSRAISGKYIQTPRGIYPMKFFFTGGTVTDSGDVASWRTIKQRIKEIVANEDKADPLSDDQIAEALKQDGFGVARRTVTKYRKMMSIPSSRRRKTY